jgi:cytochrome b involved in lipid metabolism
VLPNLTSLSNAEAFGTGLEVPKALLGLGSDRAAGARSGDEGGAREGELTQKQVALWCRFYGLGHELPLDRVDLVVAEERAARGPDPQFEARLEWLLQGTSDSELQTLDPRRDCARIHQRVVSRFRVESRVLETLAINRIAQSLALSLLIRATGKAETTPVLRFYDTYALLANVLEWGIDSRRGAEALARINGIHARYSIPNDGMKFVLLALVFTWLDGLPQIGHRELHPSERLGFFHAYIELGQAMGIAELAHDYASMQRWIHDFNAANRGFHDNKAEFFERSVGGSLVDVKDPALAHWFRVALRSAMDEAYRESIGESCPSASERDQVRTFIGHLGWLAERQSKPFIRSLQNNPARSSFAEPSELGSALRSKQVPPQIDPNSLPLITREQVAEACRVGLLWLVIHGEVYDLSHLQHIHPGGAAALWRQLGSDASPAFERAGHSQLARELMTNYLVGRLTEPDSEQEGA